MADLVERVRGMCSSRGLVLKPYGKGWRIVGPKVDVLIAYLSDVREMDLLPVLDKSMLVRKGAYAAPQDAGLRA